jgi:serine/threonine protein kinase
VPQAEVGSTASSYEILAKLATGGMAEIFLARAAGAAGLERYVVLKRVLRERATDANFVRMFLDEARLAAQLQHPNIAQVYDIGKLGDSYFFTMEYVHGETVRALLHRSHALRRPIPIGTVLTVGAGAAAGLHHAHERIGLDGKPLGIVHRDVSPSNLMISYEGHVKVVDFGVAKAAHNSQETRSGTVKGKIAYLSPEQCRGRGVDRRSDLFSLGIVLWEMLTTERLFRQASDFETMAAIVNDPTPPPSSRRPEVPPELDALVLRLLAKTPEERFQSADELLEAVEHLTIRTQIALSTAALGRFVKELFGQRPEPWVELRAAEQLPELVTVTSEPVPENYGLERVPSLSQGDLRPTVPLRASHDVLEGVPTAPMPNVDPSLPVMVVGSQTLMSTSPPPPHMMASPFAPAPSSASNPFSTSGSVPHRVSPFGGTGSVSAQQAAPAAARKVPRIVLVLVPAIVIGVILGLVFARGGKHHPPQPAVHPDEGSAIAMTSVDAAVATPVVVDAAVVVPVAVDAAVAPADAAPVAEHVVKKPSPEDQVLAACHAHDLAKAKKLLSSVPSSKRASVIGACPALAPRHEDSEDCKHNPLACQH